MFKVLSLIVSVFFVIWLLFFVGWMPSYSDGQRTGEVYKFSRKGIFYKSWEGSMYLGGASMTTGENPTLQLDKFGFSIPEGQEKEKSAVIETLNKCASERKTCTIYYKEWLKGPIYQSTGYTVERVEIRN